MVSSAKRLARLSSTSSPAVRPVEGPPRSAGELEAYPGAWNCAWSGIRPYAQSSEGTYLELPAGPEEVGIYSDLC